MKFSGILLLSIYITSNNIRAVVIRWNGNGSSNSNGNSTQQLCVNGKNGEIHIRRGDDVSVVHAQCHRIKPLSSHSFEYDLVQLYEKCSTVDRPYGVRCILYIDCVILVSNLNQVRIKCSQCIQAISTQKLN